MWSDKSDGFKQNTTTSFHLLWNIYDQSLIEDDWSVGTELQTDEWFGANGLSIDWSASQNGIPVTELESVKKIWLSAVLTLRWSAVSIPALLEIRCCIYCLYWHNRDGSVVFLLNLHEYVLIWVFQGLLLNRFSFLLSKVHKRVTEDWRGNREGSRHPEISWWLHAQFSLVLRQTSIRISRNHGFCNETSFRW